MKFTIKLGVPALIMAIALSTGCKKDDNSTDNNTNNPTNPTVNQLCDGKGTNSYLPLVQQNSWEWKQQGSGNIVHKWKVNGTQTFNSVNYLKMNIVWDSGLTETERYFRAASNGDVYQYSTYYGAGQEFLYVPASPTLNQQWDYPVSGSSQGTGKRKVTSVNASITTSSCSYTGLVTIAEYSGSSLITTYYYKKGLGLVRFNSLVNSDLRATSLN